MHDHDSSRRLTDLAHLALQKLPHHHIEELCEQTLEVELLVRMLVSCPLLNHFVFYGTR